MMIDAHLAELIDDDRDALAVRRGQDAIEQGGFSRAEKTRQNGYRYARFLGRVGREVHEATTLSGTHTEPSISSRAARASADLLSVKVPFWPSTRLSNSNVPEG